MAPKLALPRSASVMPGPHATTTPTSSIRASGFAPPGVMHRLMRSAASSGGASGSSRQLFVAASARMNWANRDNERSPRSENVEGDFFVDHTCIDCDTCRWMAPATFGRAGQQSAVLRQPQGHEQRVEAMKALLSCPTFSIHVRARSAAELRDAQAGLPAPVPGVVLVNAGPGSSGSAGVYYTGWTTEKSYAGCPYLIVRPPERGGNVLVDSPRFNPALLRRLKELGGVRWMFLTHRDDVGDHVQWAAALGAQRILHEDECNERQGTDKVEIKLRGEGPWALRHDGVHELPAATAATAATASPSSDDSGSGARDDGDDLTLVFTPGHTRGHVCAYYAPARALFSGDHLCGGDDDPGELHIFEDFNWYSVPQQRASVAKLLQYDFLHVLPAHGRRAVLRDAEHRLRAVAKVAGGAAVQQALANDAAAARTTANVRSMHHAPA